MAIPLEIIVPCSGDAYFRCKAFSVAVLWGCQCLTLMEGSYWFWLNRITSISFMVMLYNEALDEVRSQCVLLKKHWIFITVSKLWLQAFSKAIQKTIYLLASQEHNWLLMVHWRPKKNPIAGNILYIYNRVVLKSLEVILYVARVCLLSC